MSPCYSVSVAGWSQPPGPASSPRPSSLTRPAPWSGSSSGDRLRTSCRSVAGENLFHPSSYCARWAGCSPAGTWSGAPPSLPGPSPPSTSGTPPSCPPTPGRSPWSRPCPPSGPPWTGRRTDSWPGPGRTWWSRRWPSPAPARPLLDGWPSLVEERHLLMEERQLLVEEQQLQMEE